MKLLNLFAWVFVICFNITLYCIRYIWNYQSTSIFDDPSLGYYVFSILGTIACIVLIIAIIDHLDRWLNKSYYYDKFIKKREYYVLALKEARANGREGETFKILEKTVNWNLRLAENQVKCNHYLYDCYIDKRILTVEPIK